MSQEGPGILNWAIEGFRQWQLRGLKKPPEVTAAISEYRTSEDIVGNFLAECYDEITDAQSGTKETFSDFRTWCDENSVNKLTKTKFSRELGRFGIKLDPGRRFYVGITKRSPF